MTTKKSLFKSRKARKTVVSIMNWVWAWLAVFAIAFLFALGASGGDLGIALATGAIMVVLGFGISFILTGVVVIAIWLFERYDKHVKGWIDQGE